MTLPTPYFQDELATVFHGNAREIAPLLSGISAVVTDPPYELGFMGRAWDSKGVSFQPETWRLIRQACKPGAMLLSFGGTRTFHRIAVAIEDAGWEIRDTVMWVYGSGFPKSLDISKAIDKTAGAEREVIATVKKKPSASSDCNDGWVRPWAEGKTTMDITVPATPAARLWDGYGTALKPAWEPIIVAMNPLDGTFAANALEHGVAGLNIDGCRVGMEQSGWGGGGSKLFDGGLSRNGGIARPVLGRFPANLIHDGSEEVLALFPQTASGGGDKSNKQPMARLSQCPATINTETFVPNSGSAARFFYCAKASRAERDAGLEGIEAIQRDTSRKEGNPGGDNPRNRGLQERHNSHPTVKPLALMVYLCKLVTMPEYNLVLDPFCGSGSTLLACRKLGLRCIGIDSDEKSCEIAAKRMSQGQMPL